MKKERKRKAPLKKLRKRQLNSTAKLLLLGLGNPGPQYKKTRHNAGFLVADELARRLRIDMKEPRFSPFAWGRVKTGGVELYCVKPYTYMNRSGSALGQIFRKTGCSIGDALIVCDSLDLEPGTIRIKRKGGSAGQKGLESIIAAAGSNNFSRIFIGIGRPEYKGEVPSYVLDEPGGEEAELFFQSIQKAADAVEKILSAGLDQVMNEYNRST